MKKKLLLGCVADDFTGASDAASFIAESGMKTMLFNGVPKDAADYGIDSAVIALKTRTDRKEKAVSDSMKAAEWLLDKEAEHIYSKYCSTFDSTPEGNIGPIMDAILEKCKVKSSILCPALPVNGRTVKEGILYVNGVPLAESPMKDHPLTPMRESHVGKLMESQSKYPCIMINRELLYQPEADIMAYIDSESRGEDRYYLVPDFYMEEDAKRIAELFGSMKVQSGGSGILTELCRSYMAGVSNQEQLASGTEGRGIVLAGSCSKATRNQIETFQSAGCYSYKIDPLKLAAGTETPDSIWQEVQTHGGKKEVLIYSSDTPEHVLEIQKTGRKEIADLIEETFSVLAVMALKEGFKKIIVAGGETSGAVTQALGYDAFYIGESIAPGVPVMIPAKDEEVRLVLKSGNFGQPDFFLRALEQTALRKEEA